MAEIHSVNVNLHKKMLKEHLSLFCSELKSHIDNALGDVLEPDEINVSSVIHRQITDAKHHPTGMWLIRANVALYLIHPEVLDNIERIIREIVRRHADTFSPPHKE